MANLHNNIPMTMNDHQISIKENHKKIFCNYGVNANLALNMGASNKSLQLSPKRPLGSVHAIPNSMRGQADTARQLSLSLGSQKKGYSFLASFERRGLLTENHKMVTLPHVSSSAVQLTLKKNRADARIGKGEIGYFTGATTGKRTLPARMG